MTEHDHSDPWHICPDEEPPAPIERPAPGILVAQLDGWPAVIDRVLSRDGRCIYADVGPIIRIGVSIERGLTDHFCRDLYGEPIPWHRLRASVADLHRRRAVELDHIKEELAMGIKAPDDEAHLVVACHGAHHGGLSTSDAGREFSRRWLSTIYPQVWARFVQNRLAVEGRQG
jgi:hypothetical protein